MKLYGSVPSPFVRKIRVIALETGLELDFESLTLSPVEPHAAVSSRNPLGKVPVLELDDGTLLYDSRVIAEYLLSLTPAQTLLPTDSTRWDVLRTQALADGLLDCGIQVRYEVALRPPELHWPAGIEIQCAKVLAALDELENQSLSDTADLGTIAVACAIGWLLHRRPLDSAAGGPVDIATRFPQLSAWYERFNRLPSLQATRPD